jgi:ABC-type glutathione transport system ATPase component
MHSPAHFLLDVRRLSKTYAQGRLWQRKFFRCALDDVSFTLRSGTTLALIGESGSGKTTLAMCLVGLEEPDAGDILLDGRNLGSLTKHERIAARSQIQLIFQDSAHALNPGMSAIDIIEEPLLLQGKHSRSERRSLSGEMMERVGISPSWKFRCPHEFSGGQRQRLAIGRALMLLPKVLILDEIFVGLDLSMQGQIANLLLDLQRTYGLTYICISHNLSLAARMADTIAVMRKGRIVDTPTPEQLFARSLQSKLALAPQRLVLRARSGSAQ